MPLLEFKVAANYTEVRRLKEEVYNLEQKLKTFTPGRTPAELQSLNTRLAVSRDALRKLETEAAVAGAKIEQTLAMGANRAAASIDRLQAALHNPVGTVAAVAGLGALVSQLTAIRGQFQLMEANINTLVGEQRGQKLMAQLTDFAKRSPLDFKGTVGGAQMMLGFGVEAEKVPRFLEAIGDVSMGNAQRFNQLTLAFSQMSAAGKLMGQDLLQMVNAGFQPLNIMAEKTGKSIGQLKEEMSKGKISAEMVQQAFIDATSAGGKYFGMSEKASATIPGQMSMLEDAFDLMWNDIGKKGEQQIVKIIGRGTQIVENWEKILPVIGKVVAAVGLYKGMQILNNFAEKAAGKKRTKEIEDSFKEEFDMMEKAIAERKKLKGEAEALDAAEAPKGIVKGARYNDAKVKQLLGPDTSDISKTLAGAGVKDNATEFYASRTDALIAARQKLIQANVDLAAEESAMIERGKQVQAEIDAIKAKPLGENGTFTTEQKQKLDGLKKELKEIDSSLDTGLNGRIEQVQKAREQISNEIERTASKDSKYANRDVADLYNKSGFGGLVGEDRAEMIRVGRGYTQTQLNSLESQLAKKESESSVIKDKLADKGLSKDAKGSLEKQSAAIDADITNLRKQIAEKQHLIDEYAALGDKVVPQEGSKAYKQQQLSQLQGVEANLGAEQHVSDYGKQVHEQIEGLKADLEGFANLDSDLKQAVEMGDVQEAMAQQIQDKRNELEDLAAASQETAGALQELGEAQSDIVTSTESVAGVLAESTDATETVLEAVSAVADSTEGATAATDMQSAAEGANTAEKDLNAIAAQRQATQEKLNTTAKATNTATTTTNTAAENVNLLTRTKNGIAIAAQTIKTKALSVAEAMGTAVTNAWTASVQALNAAWKSNPIGLVISAVMTLYTIISSLIGQEEKLTDQQKEYGEETMKNVDNVKLLYAQMEASAKGTKLHKEAVDGLKSSMEAYGIKLNEEVDLEKQLIAHKEQLIQLLMEEGRQRILLSNIKDADDKKEEYRKEVKTELTEYFKDSGASSDERAESYARLFMSYVDEDKYLEVLEKIEEAKNKIQLAYEQGNTEAVEAAHKESEQAVNEWMALMETGLSKVKGDAAELGDTLEFDGIFSTSMRDMNAKLSEIYTKFKPLIIETETYKKLLEESKEKTDALADTTKKALSDMNSSELIKEIQTQSENAKPTVDVKLKADTEELDKALKMLDAETAKTRTVDVKSDASEVKGTTAAAKEATEQVETLDGTSATPKADSSSIQAAGSETDTTTSKLINLDSIIATPIINDSSIANALRQLQMVEITLGNINGTPIKRYATPDQQYRMNRLTKSGAVKVTYGKDGKVHINGEPWAVKIYTKDYSDVKAQNYMTVNGKEVKLNQGQAMVNAALMQHYGTHDLSKAEMSDNDRRLYNALFNEARTSTLAGASSSAKAARAEFSKQADKANSDAELDEYIKSLNQLIGSAEYGSVERDWAVKKRKELQDKKSKYSGKQKKNKKKGGGNSGKSQKQIDYEYQKALEKEADEERKMRRDAERKIMDETIDLMVDGFHKDMLTIIHNANKREQDLYAEQEALARQLRDSDIKLWMDSKTMAKTGKGKGPKLEEYMYYEDSANKETKKDDFQYWLDLAKERMRFSERSALAVKQTEKAWAKFFDGIDDTLVEHLSNYGSTLQKAYAIELKYQRLMRDREEMTDYEVRKLQAEKQREIAENKGQGLRDSLGIATFFKDFNVLSFDAILSLRKQLETFVNSAEFSNAGFSIEQMREYYDLLEEATAFTGADTKQSLQDVSAAIGDYNKALKEREETDRRLARATVAYNRLHDAATKKDSERQAAEAERTEAYQKLMDAEKEKADAAARTDKGAAAAQKAAADRYAAAQKRYNEALKKSAEFSANTEELEKAKAEMEAATQAMAESNRTVAGLQNQIVRGLTGVTGKFQNISKAMGVISDFKLTGLWDLMGKGGQNWFLNLLPQVRQGAAFDDLKAKGLFNSDAFSKGLQSMMSESLGKSSEAFAQELNDFIGNAIGDKRLKGLLGKANKAGEEAYNKTLAEAMGQGSSKEDAEKSANAARANAAGDVINSVANLGSQGAAGMWGQLISAFLQLLDEFMERGLGNLVQSLLDNIGNALGGIINNLLTEFPGQLMDGLGSLATGILGGFSSLFGQSFESDKHLEEDIEKLTRQNRNLEQAINNLADTMAKLPLDKALDLFAKQNRYLEEETRNKHEELQRSANASTTVQHSSAYEINKALSGSNWSEISRLLGRPVNTIQQLFANITPEQLKMLKDNLPTIYSKIQDAAKDGYKDIADIMDEFVELAGKSEELSDSMKQRLTSATFDSVKSEFASMLMDMNNSAQAFSDNFEQMLRTAVINAMVDKLFTEDIQKWYDKFAEFMNTDVGLSQAEAEELRADYENLTSQAIEKRDALFDLMGWDSFSQQATTREFNSMSEDTGNEMNGRLAAIQVRVEDLYSAQEQERASLAELTKALVEDMASRSQSISALNDIQEQLANCFLEFVEIRENTGNMVAPIREMNATLAEIQRKLKNL